MANEIGSGSGSGYPSSIDVDGSKEIDSPDANATLVRAATINDLSSAIIAIQTTLGINPQGSADDVVTLFGLTLGITEQRMWDAEWDLNVVKKIPLQSEIERLGASIRGWLP